MSLRIQLCLNAAVARYFAGIGRPQAQPRHFWSNHRVRIPQVTLDELAFLRSTLRPTSSLAHVWSRPIGLLIPRSPDAIPESDASYEGMGGLCDAPHLRFIFYAVAKCRHIS